MEPTMDEMQNGARMICSQIRFTLDSTYPHSPHRIQTFSDQNSDFFRPYSDFFWSERDTENISVSNIQTKFRPFSDRTIVLSTVYEHAHTAQ